MVKVKYILLLLIFVSCRSSKNITKVIDKTFEKKEIAIKKDSTSVKTDTSEYNTEITIEYDSSIIGKTIAYAEHSPYYIAQPYATADNLTVFGYDNTPVIKTTQKIKRITIKSKTDLHKKDSTELRSTDSTKTETKTFTKKVAEQKKTALSWYWYLLLIAVLLYYAYRTAKRYKIF